MTSCAMQVLLSVPLVLRSPLSGYAFWALHSSVTWTWTAPIMESCYWLVSPELGHHLVNINQPLGNCLIENSQQVGLLAVQLKVEVTCQDKGHIAQFDCVLDDQLEEFIIELPVLRYSIAADDIQRCFPISCNKMHMDKACRLPQRIGHLISLPCPKMQLHPGALSWR